MALKKKKIEQPEVVEEQNQEEEVLTPDEVEAIQVDEKRRIDASANMERLQLATRIVSETFNLDDGYSVVAFNDKGKVVSVSLTNGDFVVSVTIKNSEAHGMYLPE